METKKMRKAAMYLAGGAMAVVAALTAAQPAEALPGDGFNISAVSGTFTLTPPGDISNTTSAVNNAASLIALQVTGAFSGVVLSGASVVLVSPTLPFPVVAGPVLITPTFTMTVDGLEFTFDTAQTVFRLPTIDGLPPGGFLSGSFTGELTNGNGIFQDGTAVRLTETCTQAASGVPVGCGFSFNAIGTLITIVSTPEPASLTLLGASLLGFGLLWRRRAL